MLGQPFGTINDGLLLVMVAALLPVMLAHYELGGVVPLWPARLSLVGASAAVVAWVVIQAAFVVGAVTFDYDHAATGAMAVQAWLLALIGLWIAGASLLAGRWLPNLVRTLGVFAGLSTVLAAAGLLQGGMTSSLGWIGAPGYLVGLPVWAWLLSRAFREATRTRAAAAAVEGPAPA
jgi:hypothetical protein